jgi:hypothetical protein
MYKNGVSGDQNVQSLIGISISIILSLLAFKNILPVIISPATIPVFASLITKEIFEEAAIPVL